LTSNAWFSEARFAGDTRFVRVTFAGHARFRDTEFGGETQFSRAYVADEARFHSARFAGDAQFDKTAKLPATSVGARRRARPHDQMPRMARRMGGRAHVRAPSPDAEGAWVDWPPSHPRSRKHDVIGTLTRHKYPDSAN